MCKLLKIAQDIWAVLQSLPSRERGLKFLRDHIHIDSLRVAPLAGARIEIYRFFRQFFRHCVAPLAGARIEISADDTIIPHFRVAPIRGSAD